MRRIDHKIAYILILVVFFGVGSVFAARFVNKTKKDVAQVKQTIEEIVPIAVQEVPNVDETIKNQVSKTPPKHTTQQTVSTKSTENGKVTTIADAGLPAGQTEDFLANCKTSSAPSGVAYYDRTGRYPNLATVLREYLPKLRWGGEINSFCGIYVIDAGDTGWSGQYLASYVTSGNRITSAKGAILLNATYYTQYNESTFNEYMKLILSHEYGHHYTQYHKWIDMNLPIESRFPDQYYNERPLSKASTSVDCSNNWQSCESEIIAEDYSYIYSGYGFHQMADRYGYPSGATRSWFDSLIGAHSEPEPEAPQQNKNTNLETPEPAVPVANENTNVSNNNTNSTPTDTTKPVISVTEPTSPYDWTSAVPSLKIKIHATDNIGVTKMVVYINDQYQGETTYSGATLTWTYADDPAGTYTLKAEAYDAAGNVGETLLTINKQ